MTSALASTGFFSHSSRLRFFFSAMRLKKLCIHLARIQKLTADINGVSFGVECIGEHPPQFALGEFASFVVVVCVLSPMLAQASS